MTIGAADVTAFIGADGPYWTDLDGAHDVSWSFNTGTGDDASRTITAGSVKIGAKTYEVGDILPADVVGTLTAADGVLTFGSAAAGTQVSYGDKNGDGFVDVGETGELNQNSVGFAITDLDVGIALMVSTNPLDLGVYLAGKLSVHDFGLVGVPNLTATGTFDVELNVGIGASGLDLNVNPINFDASFNEMHALFAVFAGSDSVITTAEMNAALAAGYAGGDVTTVQQLLLVLGGPSLTSVLGQLSASFQTAHLAAIQAADVDSDGRLNIDELQTLFNLIDTSGNHHLEASELNAALPPPGYSGATLDTVQDLLSALYLGAAPPVAGLLCGLGARQTLRVLQDGRPCGRHPGGRRRR